MKSLCNFSIIIPVFNEEKRIWSFHNRIKNILNTKCEILYINDKSTDNTEQYLCEIKKTSAKIYVFTNSKNLGPTKSANFGAGKAKGHFLYFASVSDKFDTSLFKFKKINTKYSLITFNYYVQFFYFIKMKKKPFLSSTSKFYNPESVIKNFELTNTIIGGAATIFNRREFIKYGSFPCNVGGHSDFALIYKLALTKGIYYINKTDVVYNYNFIKKLSTHKKNFSKKYQLVFLTNIQKYFKKPKTLKNLFLNSKIINKLPFGDLV